MKSIVLSLLLSSIMFGMFYMYVRQKFVSYETKFQSMFDIIQSMAIELKNRRDESESDSDSDDSSDLYEKKVINLSQMDSPFDFSVHLCNEVTKLPVESPIPLEITPDVMVEPKVEDMPVAEPEVAEVAEVELQVVEVELEVVEVELEVVEVELEVELEVVEVDDMSTKSISTDLYDGLSVKELKERVSILGGPPLKTRKALMDFLKSKL